MFKLGARALIIAQCAFLGACSPIMLETHKTPISSQLLDASANVQWLTYGHDYNNQRFSVLSEINVHNVDKLYPAYVFQTGVAGAFEATPLVFDGTMYITSAYDGVFALNAETGELLWKRPPLSGKFTLCCGPVNRGVAISNALVLVGQLDGVLVALDRASGTMKWATVVENGPSGYSITMAPVVYKNTVIVGVAGSEFGVRGSLSCYSLADGRLIWRWYSTDSKHWFGPSQRLLTDMGRVDGRTSEKLRERFKDSWKRGGGGIWTTPAIDPKRNIVYFTTGNPWPDFDGSSRPGDNLFTDCVVALDATTGEIKWYFQESAHDVSDLDAASPPVLLTTIDDAGRSVEAVAEVGKTGAFYLLDRGTGALIRKTRNVAVFESHGGAKGWEGGSEWSAMSYDPSAQYAIVTTEQHLKPETGTSAPSERRSVTKEWSSGYGSVSAIMPASGQIAWQDKFDEGMVGGTVSTAGGLTFTGEANGYFDALETKTGARLWHFQTGAGVNAAPIVFQAGQHEYVAVASGGNRQLGTNYGDAVFVFRLDGH